MRIPRLYTPQALATGRSLTITDKPAHHVMHVLRLRSGSPLRVFDGEGNEYDAVIQNGGRDGVTLEIGPAIETLPESCLRITLAQGIARHDRMDMILQKTVELGIHEIQPLWMQRSQKHLNGERLQKRIRHWQGVITSACEQCGRATLPSLLPPLHYPDWVSGYAQSSVRLMLQPDSTQTLASMVKPPGSITLLVGPEGGLEPAEQSLATVNGFSGVRLGARILRTETAALAALAGMHSLWGDFR